MIICGKMRAANDTDYATKREYERYWLDRCWEQLNGSGYTSRIAVPVGAQVATSLEGTPGLSIASNAQGSVEAQKRK